MYETDTASTSNTDAHVYNETQTIIINAFIERLLTKIVLQEVHDLVIQTLKWTGKDKMEFGIWFFRAAGHFRSIVSDKNKASHYVCRLKLSIYKEMLEELQRKCSDMRLNTIDIRHTAAAKG